MKRQWFLIIILASTIFGGMFFRLYKLGRIPYGYAFDEVAMAYDAWSISLWNRDQYANRLPLAFKSFGDYKPPVLIYTLAIIYKLTGLQLEYIRYLSAIAGISTIAASYALALELFHSRKSAVVTAAVVAISPWSLHLSRVGFEQNLALFLGITGLWLYLKSYKTRTALVPSLFLLVLSCYTFHTAKVFVPLALVVTAWYKSEFNKPLLTRLIIKLAVVALLLLPLLQSNARASVLFFFNDAGQIMSIEQIFTRLFQNIINQTSPRFFVSGWDAVSLRHAAPGHGVLLWPSYILLLVSLVKTIKSGNRTQIYLWFLLVAGLAPAIISHPTPHVIRSQFGLIGAAVLVGWIGSQLKPLFFNTALVLSLIQLGMYGRSYFTVYASQSALDYQYGYQEVFSIANQYPQLERVITDAYQQPYIYALLHNKITPQNYLWGGLNQYQFRPIHWPESPGKLYIATPQEIPPTDPSVIHIITIPNTNQIAWVIAKP